MGRDPQHQKAMIVLGRAACVRSGGCVSLHTRQGAAANKGGLSKNPADTKKHITSQTWTTNPNGSNKKKNQMEATRGRAKAQLCSTGRILRACIVEDRTNQHCRIGRHTAMWEPAPADKISLWQSILSAKWNLNEN